MVKAVKITRELRGNVPPSLKRQIRKALPSEVAEYLLSRIVGWEDAQKQASITITEEDVKHAVPGDTYRCAAALGVRREWSDTVFVAVTHSIVWRVRTEDDVDGYVAERGSTSRALRTQIDNLDTGGDFEPGVYYILPPSAPAPKGGQKWGDIYKGNKEHQNCSDKAVHPKDGTACRKCGYRYIAHPRTQNPFASRSLVSKLEPV